MRLEGLNFEGGRGGGIPVDEDGAIPKPSLSIFASPESIWK